jgi:threonine dehydratase
MTCSANLFGFQPCLINRMSLLLEPRPECNGRARAADVQSRALSPDTLVSLDDIRAAARRVAPIARVTPLVDVSAPAGRALWLKCESLQPGGAFKIRGAYNMVAQLTDAERRRGVITYSSGNHGQAMALAARELGAPAVVVMPKTAPQIKIDGARSFGAEVIFEGTTSVDRRIRAEREAAARQLTMVPPFDHPWIIAGQGTAGLEILEQLPDVGAVLVPIGGGGLIAGVAAAIKLTRPQVKVIGVEPDGAAAMKVSVEAGHPVTLAKTETIADGLMPVRPGDLTFAHVRQFVDEIVTVTDLQIVDAVLWLFSNAKIVAEPSGAAAVAAALIAKPRLPGPVVAIVSGGNIAMERLEELRRLAR